MCVGTGDQCQTIETPVYPLVVHSYTGYYTRFY